MAFARTATAAHTTTVVGADDHTKEINKDQWNGTGAHTVTPGVTGADVGGIPYCPTATTEVTSSSFTWNAATGQGLVMAAGTATTDVAAMSLTRTNNNAAVVTGVKWVFTDTTSAAGFTPLNILGGSAGTTIMFYVTKAGQAGAQNFGTEANGTAGTVAYGFTGTTTGLYRLGNLIAVSASSTAYHAFGENVISSTPASVTGWGATAGDPSQALDTGFSRISAGVIGVGTGAQGSVAGAIRGLYQAADGTAGVAAFGPAVVTSITIKNGLVVAIS